MRDRARDHLELAAALGHDLKGPLNTISLFAKLAGRGIQVDQSTQHIDTSARHLASVFAKLATYLARTPDEAGTCALAGFNTFVSERWPGIDITLSDGEVPLECGATERVLEALIDNALLHGAPPVQVRMEGRDLVVTDAGAGFVDPVRALRLLGTSLPESHAGLGLNEVRLIAEAHGGQLSVEKGSAVVRLSFA